jgi:hypothetical protein
MFDFMQAFRRNADGSWTCVEPITLVRSSGPVHFSQGATFRPESMFMGIRVAKYLDELAKYPSPDRK